jgi:hypothetical protein
MLENAMSMLSIAKLLNQGGIHIGKFIFLYKKEYLTVLNIISNKKQIFKINELIDAISNPIMLSDLMNSSNKTKKILQQKYYNQKVIQEITPILLANRKRLGISWIKN